MSIAASSELNAWAVGSLSFFTFTLGHALDFFGGSADTLMGTALLVAVDVCVALLVSWAVLRVLVSIRAGLSGRKARSDSAP